MLAQRGQRLVVVNYARLANSAWSKSHFARLVLVEMLDLQSGDEAAAAADELARKMGEIYKHECHENKKKESCHLLAEFYLAVERDVGKAKELYKFTCEELDLAESCFALGNLHLTQKKFRDPHEAVKYLHKACDRNSAGACGNAGLLYQNGMEGTDIEKDIHKAMGLFQKACDLGARNGCFNMSAVYLTGTSGIPKDMKKAFDMSLKSCNMGHSWGCANVSRMYALGDGIVKDSREAERFKKLAKRLSGQGMKTS